MTVQLNLYSTTHCHLCDQATDLLDSLSEQYDIRWMNIEITEDSALLECYGSKIPVLKRQDNNAELEWPFTTQQIETLIST